MSPAGPRRTTRVRPSLSRDTIAETALRLTLEQPTTPLTLARLGTELHADPTALYRHFRSRDELVRDLGDRLFADVLAEVDLSGEWDASLRSIATALRSVLLHRPALAADLGTRFTGGPNERDGVLSLRTVLTGAGFPDDDIPRMMRAFGELMLSHVVMTASMLALSPDEQEFEMRVAMSLYGPGVGATSLEYEDDTFSMILETYIAGLRTQLHVPGPLHEGAKIHHERGHP